MDDFRGDERKWQVLCQFIYYRTKEDGRMDDA